MASAAQWERKIIGQRTREALAIKKTQGVRLGRPSTIDPALARRIRGLRSRGWTLQRICTKLDAEEVPTPRGGQVWRPSSISALLAPLEDLVTPRDTGGALEATLSGDIQNLELRP